MRSIRQTWLIACALVVVVGCGSGDGVIDPDPTPEAPVTLTVALQGTGAGRVVSSAGGIDCGSQCSASVEKGTVIVLTATASPGSKFLGWSGSGCVGTASCSVTLVVAAHVVAQFLAMRRITIDAQGTGSGTITSDPAGLDCGEVCELTLDDGAQFQLFALPDDGSYFAGWADATCGEYAGELCVGTAVGDLSISPVFNKREFVVTVVNANPERGRLVSSPAGIDCGLACSTTFLHGTEVTITAEPLSGFLLNVWSGACSGSEGCAFTVTGDTEIVGGFTSTTHTLWVAIEGTGAGTVTVGAEIVDCATVCSTVYAHGTEVTLTATAVPGSTFAGWSNVPCTGTDPCVLPITEGHTAIATFTAND